MDRNTLFYGDNLHVLRKHIASESVDLVYLDPPFNSNRDYNVLFKEQSGLVAEAQVKTFADTWEWTEATQKLWQDFFDDCGNHRLTSLLYGLVNSLGHNSLTAYLVNMAPRLVELHRVLRPTGSLYLHCDPAASHYLKIVLDMICGPSNFRNEIVWERTGSKGLAFNRLACNHDVILFYGKGENTSWNRDALFSKYDEAALDPKTASKYSHRDPDGRLYQLDNLINPNPNRPNLTYEFLGVTRVWRWTRERMQAAYEAGLVVQPSPGSVPRLKRYLDEQAGKVLDDVWSDIPPLNSQAKERLGYPTQKPVALLERILKIASSEGDIVLDPFCGCGTTIMAAQKLDRRWIGIDITATATSLIKARLKEANGLVPSYGPAPGRKAFTGDYDVIGEPTTEQEAIELANDDKHEFQKWAISLIPRAKPWQEKKGADGGVDGFLRFRIGAMDREPRLAIISVKGGKNVDVKDVRELAEVMSKQGADFGFLITLQKPTTKMTQWAMEKGMVQGPEGAKYPSLQIRTVHELLEGKTFSPAPEVMMTGAMTAAGAGQGMLFAG